MSNWRPGIRPINKKDRVSARAFRGVRVAGRTFWDVPLALISLVTAYRNLHSGPALTPSGLDRGLGTWAGYFYALEFDF